ncbi:MAG: choice-of-anchor E domain-containing protein [Gammaproteobacteria bacterium]|nr:choice-of-anchor E domain-containing protein [Gammaproteobacteria bacterium]
MKKTLATLLTSGALALSALPAHALPITQSFSIITPDASTGPRIPSAASPATGAGNTNRIFAGFDSSLGTLDSVLLQLRGTQTLTTEIAYYDAFGTATGTLAGASSLDMLLGSVRFSLSSLTATANCGLPICIRTETTSLPLAVDLFGRPGTDLYGYFATNATVNLGLLVFVEAKVLSGIDDKFVSGSRADYLLKDIRLDLTYNYTPSIAPPPPPPPGSVPEPATPVLLLLGLGLMFAASRRVRGAPFGRPGLNLA